jgi:hypothetical protein
VARKTFLKWIAPLIVIAGVVAGLVWLFHGPVHYWPWYQHIAGRFYDWEVERLSPALEVYYPSLGEIAGMVFWGFWAAVFAFYGSFAFETRRRRIRFEQATEEELKELRKQVLSVNWPFVALSIVTFCCLGLYTTRLLGPRNSVGLLTLVIIATLVPWFFILSPFLLKREVEKAQRRAEQGAEEVREAVQESAQRKVLSNPPPGGAATKERKGDF